MKESKVKEEYTGSKSIKMRHELKANCILSLIKNILLPKQN